MSGLSRETRLQIMLTDAELSAIDDWRFKHRMPSRAAAIRQLLQVGLSVSQAQADPGKRSRDFGLLGAKGDGHDESNPDGGSQRG
jgi:hypothetical protein